MTVKVLLYSGGMDSWLVDKLWQPDIKLYVDMGTTYSKVEMQHLPVDVVTTKLDLAQWEREDAIIPLRNLYLVMIATNYGDEIMLGATAGDRVLDKTFEFADKASDLLSYLYKKQHWTGERKITINLESKNYTKKQLVKMYLDQGGDLERAVKESFSCYYPAKNMEPCWMCKPCFRKYVAFKLNGYKFPLEVNDKARIYFEDELMRAIEDGTYDRKDEIRDILTAVKL